MTVLIQREPVLNRHKTITASRLRVHADSCAEAAMTLNHLGDIWPTARSVLVGLVGCQLNADVLAWRPAQNVMVEIPATRLGEPLIDALIAEMVIRQVPLCLDDYRAGLDLPPGANFSFLLASLGDRSLMQNAPALLLAKGLQDNADFTVAISSGYAGATGWFFRHTEAKPGDKMNPAHLQIVKLLNLVRSNAEVKDIELALKQDVTLAFKLLRYINSAGFGLAGEVHSFRNAVTMMGYDKLNRWLSLLLVNASQDPIAPALMQTAVIRGRYMELIGKALVDQAMHDDLFIAGAFSVLDIMLGTRMDVVLEHLQLPDAIRDALLRQGGPITPLLELALVCEDGNHADIQAGLDKLGLNADQSNRALIEALAFADKLQFS